jgi:Ca2+-transporting ATPase
MHRPPRDPKVPIANRTSILLWLLYAVALFVGAFVPLAFGPDEPSTTHATASLTMTFVVMGLGTVFNALTNRRDPGTGLAPPVLRALLVSLVPVSMVFLATQLPALQRGLLTAPLSGPQWLAAIGLALILPVVVETAKWLRRPRPPAFDVTDGHRAVAPARASALPTPG